MIGKGSKLYSILTGACPKCHGENMYTNKNPYIFSEIQKINDSCGNCGFVYRMEPSFFYGALYVSYGVSVALAIITFLVSFFILDFSALLSFICIVLVLIMLFPIIMRISRNIWINMFVSFEKEATKND